MIRVLLSAGHGGSDPGAMAQGTSERVENVQLTDKTADRLRSYGIEVIVMPHDIGDLVQEINWANANAATVDLGVQIHKNAGGGTGVETWTPSYPTQEMIDLSTTINSATVEATGLPNRGVKFAQNNRWGKLGWCDDTVMPAVLVECGFIDVDDNGDAMDNRMSAGLAKGIALALGVNIAPAPVPQPVPAPVTIAYAKLTPAKTVELIRAANLWNFAFTSWSDVQAIKQYAAGDKIDVVAIATNSLGAKYYMTGWAYNDGLIRATNGFNVNDCKDYIAPAPLPAPVPTPTPEPTPTPVTVDYSKENNNILKKIWAALEPFIAKMLSIFK